MQAIAFEHPGDEDVLKLTDVPAPSLGPTDIRVRVHATAVNRADLLQRRGLYPAPTGASPILGLECAGEVVERGAQVRAPALGARVMALLAGGGYAEEVAVDAGCTMPVPALWSDEEAGAFMEAGLTAFANIFVLGEAQPGKTVLVHGGSGGVGTAAIALCREAGIQIIVTAGGEARCARCRTLGAALAIDYKRPDSDFVAEVREVTGGRGVDIVLDAVGAPYWDKNLAALAPGGRLIEIGLSGGARGECDLAPLLRKRLHVLGSTLRTEGVAAKANLIEQLGQRFRDALIAGRLRPIVHGTVPLAEAAAAHRLVQRSEHFGKVVLRVSPAQHHGQT